MNAATFGFTLGCMSGNLMNAIVALSGFMMILSLGAGMYIVILPDSPWYLQCLGFVSPFRYGNELLLNVIL